MKKRKIMALIPAVSLMLTACYASATEMPGADEETTAASIETTLETTTETTEIVIETTAAETSAALAAVSEDSIDIDTEIEDISDLDAVTISSSEPSMPDPFPDLAEPDGTFITSDDEYEAYIVTDYSFSEDGLTGTFTYSEIVPYSQEYIESLSVGGVLDGGVVIDTLDYSAESGTVWINSGNMISFEFELQENGEYYLMDDIGCLAASPAGTSEFSISPDVLIVDNVSPYGPYGIRINENEVQYYDSIGDLDSRLQDDDVWYRPELYIRVVDGEVVLISINPHQHEPWHDC